MEQSRNDTKQTFVSERTVPRSRRMWCVFRIERGGKYIQVCGPCLCAETAIWVQSLYAAMRDGNTYVYAPVDVTVN